MDPAIIGREGMRKMTHLPGSIARVVLILATGVAAPAMAECTWDDLVQDRAQVASVGRPAARTHFVRDAALKPGCPAADVACRSAAFIVPGNVVLTGTARNGFTCAGFASGKGTSTIGWFPATALRPLPDGEQRLDDWFGRWVAPEKEITIAAGPGTALQVKGNATWGDTPERRLSGGVHTGEVEGEAAPVEGALGFIMGVDGRTLPFEVGREDVCNIRMVRRGVGALDRSKVR